MRNDLSNPYVPTAEQAIHGWYQAPDGTPSMFTLSRGEIAVRQHEYDHHRAEFIAKYGPLADARIKP